MYENGQGHLTLFYIVFVWLRGWPWAVRSPIQDPWFMYQNWLRPSGGIYYPNFVPCFVYHQLNWFLLVDMRSLDHEWTKIGPNFRKRNTSKNEVIIGWPQQPPTKRYQRSVKKLDFLDFWWSILLKGTIMVLLVPIIRISKKALWNEAVEVIEAT